MKKTDNGLSIKLIIALVGFPQISETIYTPALPSIVQGLKTNAHMVEATLAIYFLGFAVGVLIWGTISDIIGRRFAMLTGLIIYGIATLGCANVEHIESLLAWRFCQAFGASVGSIITQTILRDSFDGAERSKIFSVMAGALAFSPAIGPLLGGFISQFLGWRCNFWFLVLVSLLLFVWTSITLKETLPKEVQTLSVRSVYNLIHKMLCSPQLWGHILLIAGTNSLLFGFYQEAPFVFIEQLGLEPKVYGCLGLLIAGASLVAARLSFILSSHYTSNALIQLGSYCISIGGLFFFLIIFKEVFSSNMQLSMILALLFLIFFGIGLIIPNSLSQALKPYQDVAGTAGSIFGGCYYVLIATCTWLMSALHNGTILPLSLYILLVGIGIFIGSKMIYYSPHQKKTFELMK